MFPLQTETRAGRREDTSTPAASGHTDKTDNKEKLQLSFFTGFQPDGDSQKCPCMTSDLLMSENRADLCQQMLSEPQRTRKVTELGFFLFLCNAAECSASCSEKQRCQLHHTTTDYCAFSDQFTLIKATKLYLVIFLRSFKSIKSDSNRPH